MAMVSGWLSRALGKTTLSTPSFMEALIASARTGTFRLMIRWKLPVGRSCL